MRQTVGILGTPIDRLTNTEVLERLEQFIQERRFHQIATANTDFLINALEDPELRCVLRNADLVVPDGMPVVWASRLLRTPLMERVTGADMVPALAALAERQGYRLFMLGARPEVAQRAKANLLAKHPALQIVGCISPKPAALLDMDSEAILDEIACAKPDILLVAFGNPKQEKWISMHRKRLSQVPVCIGVGGTFDFLAGETSRAPEWMQKSGLEWVHRLAHEPRRLWRRYVRDLSQFSRFLLRQYWALRRKAGAGFWEMRVAQAGESTVLSLVGDFTQETLPGFQSAVEEAFRGKTHLVLDLHRVSLIDAEALGTLIMLPKRAAYHAREVRIITPPDPLAKTLRHSQLYDAHCKVVETMAEALSNNHCAGLCWRAQSGRERTVLTISGASEPFSVQRLEQVCSALLSEGRQVDMDLRGLAYADSNLLRALMRLAGAPENGSGNAVLPGRCRLIPGSVLLQTLQREKALARFQPFLCETPELPADAVELADDAMDKTLPIPPVAATRI